MAKCRRFATTSTRFQFVPSSRRFASVASSESPVYAMWCDVMIFDLICGQHEITRWAQARGDFWYTENMKVFFFFFLFRLLLVSASGVSLVCFNRGWPIDAMDFTLVPFLWCMLDKRYRIECDSGYTVY